MTASYILAYAAAMPANDEKVWSSDDVRGLLANLANSLEPGDVLDQQLDDAIGRMPLTPAYLAEAIGRVVFRAEAPGSDYGRCVQVSQMLGDAANQLDIKGDHARADLLREYAHAVSVAGGAREHADTTKEFLEKGIAVVNSGIAAWKPDDVKAVMRDAVSLLNGGEV